MRERETVPRLPASQEYFTLTIDGDFCDGYMVYADAYDADDTINPLASVSRRISAVDRTLSFPVDKGLAAKGLTGGEDIVIGMFADERMNRAV